MIFSKVTTNRRYGTDSYAFFYTQLDCGHSVRDSHPMPPGSTLLCLECTARAAVPPAEQRELAALDALIATYSWRDGEEQEAGAALLALQARRARLEKQLGLAR